jgi:hypothetical protein
VHGSERRWGPVIVAGLLAGCAGGIDNKDAFLLGGDGGTAFVCSSGVAAKAQIVDVSCATAGCHSASQPSAGLDLKSTGVASRLVDRPSAACAGKVLVPSSADGGYFDEKLAPNPACGAQMPISATLTAEQVTCLEEWTRNLALGGRE